MTGGIRFAPDRDGATAAEGAEEHALPRSLALHLLPGVLIAAFYVVAGVPLAEYLGYPPLLGLLLSVLVVLLPAELGFLLYLGRRRNGRLSLAGIVRYRRRIAARSLAMLVLLLLGWTVFSNALLAPVDRLVFDSAFFWMPERLLLELDVDRYPRSTLVITLLASLVVSGIAAPIVEELYFRGYLLPRIARLKGWAPVVNTVLFALYHVWTPWLGITRIIFFLPTAYLVWRRESIAIAIWVHCLGNTLGTLAMLAAVLAGRTP